MTTKHSIQSVPLSKIARETKFQLYPVDPDVKAAIVQRMKEEGGYDSGFPVLLWRRAGKSKYTLVYGYTRYAAAKEAGLTHVDACIRSFDSVDDAHIAAVEEQETRRKGTPATLLKSVEVLLPIAQKHAKENQGTRTDLATSGQICPEVEEGGTKAWIAAPRPHTPVILPQYLTFNCYLPPYCYSRTIGFICVTRSDFYTPICIGQAE
jgi:hypothetical protein